MASGICPFSSLLILFSIRFYNKKKCPHLHLQPYTVLSASKFLINGHIPKLKHKVPGESYWPSLSHMSIPKTITAANETGYSDWLGCVKCQPLE